MLVHTDRNNIVSQRVINQIGYVGYFQFGEDALIDCGYYNPRKNNSDKSKKNNWIGGWTGKDNIRSLENFRSSPEIQVKTFQEWINILCNRIRNLNINEFYGKVINGTEITESGCIAGTHLKGAGHVLSFITSNGKINGTDGNNVGVGEYIDLLALYDLETCCNRKIYIKVEENGEPVSDVNVNIESEYKEGKYYSKVGKIKNTYTSNKEGRIPVVIRHPGAVIKVTVNSKSSVITQKADKIQHYIIDITGSIKANGKLDKPSTPEPRPVPDKSPQDQRNEQNSEPQAQHPSSSKVPKEVTFNITIAEGDTKNPITNMRYYLIYEGNSKEHRTDDQGIESNITAEVGQDIEICVAGKGKLHAVSHFKVSSSHEGKTIRALLPVESFNIAVKDNHEALVKNTKFMIFYRGRKIVKQTNNQGLINVKMLVGFVYKFGLTDGTSLVTLRCLKGALTQHININEAAKNKAQGVISPTTTANKTPSSPPKPVDNPPTKPTVTKPKSNPVKEESHTEKNGRPITTVITDKAANDTTRYHIYHNGKIKRQNANATGYAEFIYYDEKGRKHNLGKSAYIRTDSLKSGNIPNGGSVYLVDERKHNSYISPDKKLGYKWHIPAYIGKNLRERYYLNGLTMAGTLGTLMKMGYQEYEGTGWSNHKAESKGSSSHFNGRAGDFRYLGKNNAHRNGPVHTGQKNFNKLENERWVKVFKTYGFQTFYTGTSAKSGVPALKGTTFWKNHHDHLHLGNQGSADSLKSRGILEDI